MGPSFDFYKKKHWALGPNLHTVGSPAHATSSLNNLLLDVLVGDPVAQWKRV